MPHTDIWIVDKPNRFTLYIDQKLISKEGAVLLEGILAHNVRHWQRTGDSGSGLKQLLPDRIS